jgi:lysophospholipase L1-like esterase
MTNSAGGQVSFRQKVILAIVGLGIGLALAGGIVVVRNAFLGHGKRMTSRGMAELKARLDRNPKAIYMFDEELSFRFKPGFKGLRLGSDHLPHETNSLGLLGSEEPDPDPAIRKILFLGDSVTYGAKVAREETFVSLMQAMAGPGAQLFNGGCPGWSTYQELLFYDKFLRKKDWSLVVVVFCLNDLMKIEWVFDSELDSRKSGELTGVTEGTGDAVRLLWLKKKFALRSETAPLADHSNDILMAWDSAHWRKYRAEVLDPLLVKKRVGAPVVFVAIPSQYQIEAAWRKAPSGEVFFPQAQLARYCREHDIPFMDPSPAFLSVHEPQPFFLDACHLSPMGHDLVSDYLWPRLARLLKNPR